MSTQTIKAVMPKNHMIKFPEAIPTGAELTIKFKMPSTKKLIKSSTLNRKTIRGSLKDLGPISDTLAEDIRELRTELSSESEKKWKRLYGPGNR